MLDNTPVNLRGDIKIEKFRNGEMIESFEDKNFVLGSAYKLLLKALSGDPKDGLWRVPRVEDYLLDNADAEIKDEYIWYEYDYNPTFIAKDSHDRWSVYEFPASINFFERGQDDQETEEQKEILEGLREELNKSSKIYLPERISNDAINFIALGLNHRHFLDNDNKMYSYKGDFSREADSDYKGGNTVASKSSEDNLLEIGFELEDTINDVEFIFEHGGNFSGNAILTIDETEVTSFEKFDTNSEEWVDATSISNSGTSGTTRYRIKDFKDIYAGTNHQVLIKPESSSPIAFSGIEIDGVCSAVEIVDSEVPLLTDEFIEHEIYKVTNTSNEMVLDARGGNVLTDSISLVKVMNGELQEAQISTDNLVNKSLEVEFDIKILEEVVENDSSGDLVRVWHVNDDSEPFNVGFSQGDPNILLNFSKEADAGNTFVIKYKPTKKIEMKNRSEESLTDPKVNLLPNEFFADSNGKVILGKEFSDNQEYYMVQAQYKVDSDFETEYKRAVINKPKFGDKKYPFYNYGNNVIHLEAEFGKNNPNYPVLVKELALSSKPLIENVEVDSFNSEDFLFSIKQVSGIRKEPEDTLKITWEVKLV